MGCYGQVKFLKFYNNWVILASIWIDVIYCKEVYFSI